MRPERAMDAAGQTEASAPAHLALLPKGLRCSPLRYAGCVPAGGSFGPGMSGVAGLGAVLEAVVDAQACG